MTTQEYAPLNGHVVAHPPAFPELPTSLDTSRPGPGHRTGAEPWRGRMPPELVLALLDAAALAAAVWATGPVNLPATAYALGVLVVIRQRRRRICQRTSDQVGRILTAAASPLIVLLPWLSAARAWHLALCSAALVMAVRVLCNGVLRAAHRRGRLIETTLVVGAGETGVLVAELLIQHSELGLRPVGFLDSCPPPQDLPLPVLGPTSELPAMIRRFGARRVIVCFAMDAEGDLIPGLRESQRMGVDICLVPRLADIGSSVPPTYLDDLLGVPLIPLRRQVPGRLGRWTKRAIDTLGSAILLCVFSPLLLALWLLVRLQSGRPALFRQVRVTGHERSAEIIKLRTLAEHGNSDTCWTVPTEESTPLGRWLRSSHADELPQLVNVLRGEMSLVGPRPERPYFAERFRREIPRYEDRTRMRAGMTGWAQVNGLHGDTSIRDRVRLDNQYIESWSPWLDAVILARTLTASVAAGLGRRR
jgi:exopolysaccharide biosynthesis polyprenyl glycosylphosphotransferase